MKTLFKILYVLFYKKEYTSLDFLVWGTLFIWQPPLVWFLIIGVVFLIVNGCASRIIKRIVHA